ncbi:MAG: DNA internalization-related competence protein ComEC/Rec2 [Chromatiales bacterium]|nr:DNA internalization-related competence protein ComEC/Rec2 [Chromatiales bacterium]
MRRSAIAFALGAFFALCLPAMPSIWHLLTISAVLVALGLRWRSLFVLAFVLGSLWVLLAASQRLADRLHPALEGQDLRVTGTVVFVANPAPDFTRFTLAPDTPGLPRRLRLSWYGASQEIVPGAVWRLTVRIWRPHAMQNPGASDYEAQLFRAGIGAVGYVRGKDGVRLSDQSGWRGALWRFRGAVDDRVEAALAGHAAAPVVRALITGFRDDIPKRLWETMRATGTIHLMAISGLHVGVVAALGFLVARRLAGFRRSRRPFNALIAGTACGWLLAAAYAALAGFSLPTLRALIMLGVVGLAFGSRREPALLGGLCVALCIVLFHDPLAMLGSGFWLSFGAVAAILWGLVVARRRRGRLRGFMYAQVALTLVLAPVLIQWQGELPVSSVLANLLAVPVFSFFVVPGALAGAAISYVAPVTGGWILHRVADGLQWVISVLQTLAVAPLAVATPGPVVTLVMLVGALLVTGPAALPRRGLGALMLGLPLFGLAARLPDGGFEVTALDVGQGLSVIVRTRRHALVFDTGPSFRSGADTAAMVVLPVLRGFGVRQPDLLILSHGDRDHVGGAATLVRRFPNIRVLGSQLLPGLGAMQRCVRGQRWVWDGVVFEVLHPPLAMRFERDNDSSCVVRIGAAPGTVLLTGDIERAAERILLDYAPELAVDVVIAPHHGSRTSSSPALVAATQPSWVVFAAASGNRWGFPAPGVVARWHRAGAISLWTGRDGAIGFRFVSGRPAAPRQHRQRARRIWHERR